MSRYQYRRVAIGSIEQEANKSHFAWIRDWSKTRQKHSKKHDIRNPYGNVPKVRKRRMSISCPSTPIRLPSTTTTQLLSEAAEKLLGSSGNNNNEERGVDEGTCVILETRGFSN